MVGSAVAPLGVFGALAANVGMHQRFGWDEPLLRALHGYASPANDALMRLVTQVGGVRGMLPLCAVIVALLLWRRRARDAAFVALAYGGAEVLDGIAKALFRSPRPHLWAWQVHESGYGFPSGHAIGSMALMSALVVLLWSTRWRWLALVVAAAVVVAVGVSRIYLGVHNPSDVLGAWMLALAWVIVLHWLLSTSLARRLMARRASSSTVARPAKPAR